MAYGVSRALEISSLEALFDALLEALPDPAAVVGSDGDIATVNDRFAELLGIGGDPFIGRPILGLFPAQESGALGQSWQEACRGARGVCRQVLLPDADGYRPGRRVDVVLEPVAAGSPDELGAAGGHAVLLRLRSPRADGVANGYELDVVERRYRQLARSAGDMVTLHSPDRTLLASWGPRAAGDWQFVPHDDDVPVLDRAWSAVTTAPEPITISFRMLTPTGSWAWVESRLESVRDAQGALLEVQTVSRDITEQRSFQQEMARLALRDPLTGLANRLLFGDRLRAAVARLSRGHGPIAVLLLDVDRFKGVNDSLGHSTGDQLLVALGARLTASVRASDTVARLSGDEFAVLVEDLDGAAAAELLAERALAALQLPYELDGGFTLTVTPSIGVTVAIDPVTTPDELMREADAALYAAKAAGRNRLATFDAPLRREVRQRLSVDQQARRALASGELFCEYQPVMDLGDGQVVLAEALVRLGDGAGGFLMPPEFLGICEDTGLVLELDRQVIALVLREIAALRTGGTRRCPVVSINLSGRSLTDPRFPEMVAGLLAASGLEGGGLAFELTEPALPFGGSGIDRTVASLAEMGIGIGLDNFGTGSSALSTLTTLEIDYVKIDGTFLASAATGPVGMSINRAVIDLARALGLAVVGQAVERPDQIALLPRLGCTLAQGFGLAPPMPLGQVPARLGLPIVPNA